MQVFPKRPVPRTTKPTCLVWYASDPCDELIQQYNQAKQEQQLADWQASVTAPFTKQIADQQKQVAEQQNQITTLQAQINSVTQQSLQNEARSQALLDGIGASLGAALAFCVALAVFQRLARTATTARPERSRAASA